MTSQHDKPKRWRPSLFVSWLLLALTLMMIGCQTMSSDDGEEFREFIRQREEYRQQHPDEPISGGVI